VGEVPALRASVDCGCVEFCLVWTPLSCVFDGPYFLLLTYVNTTGMMNLKIRSFSYIFLEYAACGFFKPRLLAFIFKIKELCFTNEQRLF
jgi:hypothetical protein